MEEKKQIPFFAFDKREPDKDHQRKGGFESFDAIMFGRNQKDDQHEKDHKHEAQKAEEKYHGPDLDWGLIMGHVDTIMDSAKQLKPMFKKLRPFTEQFLKQK